MNKSCKTILGKDLNNFLKIMHTFDDLVSFENHIFFTGKIHSINLSNL